MSGGFLPPPGAPTIETATLVAAPVDALWTILTSFESYGNWNASISKVDGPARAGATIVVRSAGEADKPVRIEALSPYVMHWVGSSEDPADFRGDHFFELEAVSATETLFLHREYFTGRHAAAIAVRYGDAIRAGFELLNACLKAEAEKVPALHPMTNTHVAG